MTTYISDTILLYVDHLSLRAHSTPSPPPPLQVDRTVPVVVVSLYFPVTNDDKMYRNAVKRGTIVPVPNYR